jgi:hypothetical protein
VYNQSWQRGFPPKAIGWECHRAPPSPASSIPRPCTVFAAATGSRGGLRVLPALRIRVAFRHILYSQCSSPRSPSMATAAGSDAAEWESSFSLAKRSPVLAFFRAPPSRTSTLPLTDRGLPRVQRVDHEYTFLYVHSTPSQTHTKPHIHAHHHVRAHTHFSCPPPTRCQARHAIALRGWAA